MAIVSLSNPNSGAIGQSRHGHEPGSAAVEPRQSNPWSIDDEPIGSGWHDSSWLLRKGLDVIEGAPLHLWPAEWLAARQ